MDGLDDNPSDPFIPDDIHSLSKSERSVILIHIADVIVHSYVDLHNVEFTCDIDKDEHEFSSTSTKQDNPSMCEEDSSEVADKNTCSLRGDSNDASQKDDNVQAYARELLMLGLIYNEFSDGIREGDGERVIRCWKFLMLIFKAAQRKNYSCEAFALLAQIKFILSPRLSQQLTWSRFINTRGGKGHNIPCDLYMEHLNRVLKDGIKGLGANKSERAITRLGKCINM